MHAISGFRHDLRLNAQRTLPTFTLYLAPRPPSFDLNAFLLTLVVPRTSMHTPASHIRLLYQSLVPGFFFVVYIFPRSLLSVRVPMTS